MKHITLLLLFVGFCNQTWAWGKRGHQIVGETAALVVSQEKNAEFMRAFSYDFGYYANVPDVVWKKPATYDKEKPEHFMDLEIFHRVFAEMKTEKKDMSKPFELSRKEFEEKFTTIQPMAGRAYWRIKELVALTEKTAEELRKLPEEKGKARQDLQEKFLNTAGPLAHYVGDLAMPLHVSENYDGQLTDQKGLHHYFEEDMVDMLYPDLMSKVHARVVSQWPKFKAQVKDKTILQLVEAETAQSLKSVPVLLKLDKGRKRQPYSKSEAQRYENMIVARLVDASLTLAEIYRRNLGWKFDAEKFYFWNGLPEFIKPGLAEAK